LERRKRETEGEMESIVENEEEVSPQSEEGDRLREAEEARTRGRRKGREVREREKEGMDIDDDGHDDIVGGGEDFSRGVAGKRGWEGKVKVIGRGDTKVNGAGGMKSDEDENDHFVDADETERLERELSPTISTKSKRSRGSQDEGDEVWWEREKEAGKKKKVPVPSPIKKSHSGVETPKKKKAGKGSVGRKEEFKRETRASRKKREEQEERERERMMSVSVDGDDDISSRQGEGEESDGEVKMGVRIDGHSTHSKNGILNHHKGIEPSKGKKRVVISTDIPTSLTLPSSPPKPKSRSINPYSSLLINSSQSILAEPLVPQSPSSSRQSSPGTMSPTNFDRFTTEDKFLRPIQARVFNQSLNNSHNRLSLSGRGRYIVGMPNKYSSSPSPGGLTNLGGTANTPEEEIKETPVETGFRGFGLKPVDQVVLTPIKEEEVPKPKIDSGLTTSTSGFSFGTTQPIEPSSTVAFSIPKSNPTVSVTMATPPPGSVAPATTGFLGFGKSGEGKQEIGGDETPKAQSKTFNLNLPSSNGSSSIFGGVGGGGEKKDEKSLFSSGTSTSSFSGFGLEKKEEKSAITPIFPTLGGGGVKKDESTRNGSSPFSFNLNGSNGNKVEGSKTTPFSFNPVKEETESTTTSPFSISSLNGNGTSTFGGFGKKEEEKKVEEKVSRSSERSL
jgi:hypothetical protein